MDEHYHMYESGYYQSYTTVSYYASCAKIHSHHSLGQQNCQAYYMISITCRSALKQLTNLVKTL